MTDVVIIGDGIIGLSTALELARAGANVRVLGAAKPGVASEAAAGLLAPSMGALSAGTRPFFMDSLRRYPSFVERLQEYEPRLALVRGLLEVSRGAPSHAHGGHGGHGGHGAQGGEYLDAAQSAALEPSIVAPNGARFHPDDASIDNVLLMRALRLAVAATTSVSHQIDVVTNIVTHESNLTVVTATGSHVSCDALVLAAGAWSAELRGLPTPVPVAPLKGQMLAVKSTVLGHPISGDDVYLVPRETEVVIGATTEYAGFDLSVSGRAIEQLRASAVDLCPSLASAPVLRSWAGVRPATPDLFPILGRDPDVPRLIYACGHSKNGILLAPGTGAAIAAIAAGGSAGVDINAFSIERFV